MGATSTKRALMLMPKKFVADINFWMDCLMVSGRDESFCNAIKDDIRAELATNPNSQKDWVEYASMMAADFRRVHPNGVKHLVRGEHKC